MTNDWNPLIHTQTRPLWIFILLTLFVSTNSKQTPVLFSIKNKNRFTNLLIQKIAYQPSILSNINSGKHQISFYSKCTNHLIKRTVIAISPLAQLHLVWQKLRFIAGMVLKMGLSWPIDTSKVN